MGQISRTEISGSNEMTKEKFQAKAEMVTKFLNENLKGEDGIAFVLLLDAKDEKANLRYNDIISNIHYSGIVKFVKDIMRAAGSIIGRQN